ncbi:sigma-70 family RNA polymerase sigma factor [Kitasatospora sp. NPDC036755]|uniref:sigma-70 family RNA polymerase sigma factor n=1 Tax=Kitasatospora sp. NPDC036755 TaxID=3154600 RepID=UPI0033DF2B17
MTTSTRARAAPRPAPRPAADPVDLADPADPADPAELMALVAAHGDTDAFAALYATLAPPVYGVALRTLRSPSHAEEVTQEVMLEVWRTAAAYRPERGSVLAWTLTLGHRRAVDRIRSTQAAGDREVRAALRERPVGESVADQAERLLDVQRVRRALARLSRPQRESLVLAYYGGYSQREIAQSLGLPLGTVKTRMRDGLRRLRSALDDHEPAGPAGRAAARTP